MSTLHKGESVFVVELYLALTRASREPTHRPAALTPHTHGMRTSLPTRPYKNDVREKAAGSRSGAASYTRGSCLGRV